MIKTVNMNNATTLLRLPPDTLKELKVVLLLRDPRSMEHDAERVSCRRQLELALTFKELAAGMGKENVRTLFYEQWTRDVPAAMFSLASWAGVSVTDEMKQAGVTKAGDPPSDWLQPEHAQSAREQEAGHWCDHFLKLVGYPLRSEIDVPENATVEQRKAALPYDQLRDPAATPITDEERQILQEMREQGEAAAWVQDSD